MNPWPRDTGAMLYQLSYEATDVGSRSIVGSYVPVKWNEKFSFPQFIYDLFRISLTNEGLLESLKKISSQN